MLLPLLGVLVLAFLAVKLEPSKPSPIKPPPIKIHSEGQDQQLTRSVLATALERLFPKGNGQWKVSSPPRGGDPGARCVQQSSAYRSSTGRAITAGYLFARWLEVRLESFVYSDAAAAHRAASAPPASQAAVCTAHALAEELRSEGYVVGQPHLFPSTTVHIAEGGRSRRIEIPSSYQGRPYDWDLDSTSVRRGRIILVVGTLTARAFLQPNQALARELATQVH